MAPRAQVHTLESLLANTDEEGDCLLWRGYLPHPAAPMVYHQGRMVSVRRVIFQLLGYTDTDGFYAASCGSGRCILPDHIVYRDASEHASHMARRINAMPAVDALRHAKAARTRRKAVSDEALLEILSSNDSAPELSRRLGISKTLITKYRRGEAGHTTAHNPWAALFTRGKL